MGYGCEENEKEEFAHSVYYFLGGFILSYEVKTTHTFSWLLKLAN